MRAVNILIFLMLFILVFSQKNRRYNYDEYDLSNYKINYGNYYEDSNNYNRNSKTDIFIEDIRKFGEEKNVYQVLSLPPWSSFNKVTQRANELINKARKGKIKINIKDVIISYMYLKMIHDDNRDKTLSSVLWEWISYILLFLLCIGIMHFLTWCAYKFNSYFAIFLILFSSFLSIFENIFPHWFSTQTIELLTSALFSILVNVIISKIR